MADWLEITNTLINLQNQQRLGEISQAQQQATNQIAEAEFRKQRDNTLFSQLVDVIVKVRQGIQDQQFLDAFLSSCIGLLSYDQLYAAIIDAETKLKASDIQVKILETLRTMVSDNSVKTNLQTSFANYLLNLNANLHKAIAELKQYNGKLIWLDPKELWKIEIGETITPIGDLVDLSTKSILFRKGNFYTVLNVNNTEPRGFYLTNDFGGKYYFSFTENGKADHFAFCYPSLPSLEKEITMAELCFKIFDDECLQKCFKAIRSEMQMLYTNTFEQVKLTKQVLLSSLSEYKQLRQSIVDSSLKSLQVQLPTKTNNNGAIIGAVIFGIILLIILLGHC
jgi:hypothetical protein